MGKYFGSLSRDGSNYGSPREGGLFGSLREAGKYTNKMDAGSPSFHLRPEPPSRMSRLANLGSNLQGLMRPYRQATAQDMANFQAQDLVVKEDDMEQLSPEQIRSQEKKEDLEEIRRFAFNM